MTYIIDANVMLLAGTNIADIPEDQLQCALKCIEFIEKFEKKRQIVLLDDEWRILDEYQNCFSIKGYPNQGSNFYQWILCNMSDCVKWLHLVEKEKFHYDPYPDSEALQTFDPPDRKYIALAYKNPHHAPIVEAADSKWWGITEELKKNNITVRFIDEKYIARKYAQKMQ